MADASSLDTGKPVQHRVLRQLTLAVAATLERGLRECFEQPIPVRFEYQEPGRKIEPHLTLINYWVERVGDRIADRVVCKTPQGDEYHRYPPLLMVARYVITAWATPPEDQDLILGATRVVYDNPDLKPRNVEDEDAIHFEDGPAIEMAPRFSLDEHKVVAEAFKMPIRPSIRVDVHFRLDSERKEIIRRVKERVVDYRKMD